MAVNKSVLHWLIPFVFVFVQWSVIARIKLSANDIIVSQKSSSGEESNICLGSTIILLALFAQKLIFGQI